MVLACIHELREYALHHRLVPAKAAALLAGPGPDVTVQLMRECQEEWTTILNMEAGSESRQLLHSKCLFACYQQTRELLTCVEQQRFARTDDLKRLVSAWFPEVQSSANLESIFADLSSAVARSGRTDCGSLANLMAVGVRGLSHRFAGDSETGSPITLESSDWVGKEVPGLKAKIWSPTSATPCNTAATIVFQKRFRRSKKALSIQCLAVMFSGTKVDFDNINKSFPSSSAYLHSHSALNHFLGFVLCHRNLA